MKNKWVIASAVLALALIDAGAQTSGSGGGASGSGASGGATTSSGTGGQNNNNNNNLQNQQLPPGLQNRQQLPPGLQNRGQVQVEPGAAATNRFTGAFTNRGNFTNGFAGGTNRFGDTNMSQTGRGGTNRVYSTNDFDFRHFDRSRFRDEATTPADQSLLIRIKQTIITQISVSLSGGAHWMPIHCSIHSGRVQLMGLVRNAEEAQQIQSTVSQIPGVSGVENALSTLPQDQALGENDRVILAQIRQVIPLTPTGRAWMPVTFDVRQGAVAIAGIVPTPQQSQQIETTVRQVPGVMQTSNTLIVDTSSSSTTSTSIVPQQ